MSDQDDVQYVDNWQDKTTQCQMCKQFQAHGGKNACVPKDKTFEEALNEYGEVSPCGHCKYFSAKDEE